MTSRDKDEAKKDFANDLRTIGILNDDPAGQTLIEEIEEVEAMHNTNAAAWRAMIKMVANSEILLIGENPAERTIKITLNTGRTFKISDIPTNVNIRSLAIAFEYLFVKLEAFPMAMEVKEL